MNNPYGNDILTLMDENGVEYTFEVLDEYDDGEKRYLALSPVFDDPQVLNVLVLLRSLDSPFLLLICYYL